MKYTRIMIAQYRDDVEPSFKGSPFVEALPPMADVLELERRLCEVPKLAESWKYEDSMERINRLLLMSEHLFVALPRHIQAASTIQNLIYGGYMFRGHQGWPKAQIEIEADQAAQTRGSASSIPRVTRGGAFLGPSGCGKTTTIDRCCAMFPQIIHHGVYKGEPFTRTQITYLRVQCPENASEKGLLQEFFGVIDELLGTSDQERYSSSRHTLNTMMSGVAMRCRENAIGLIVLDEVEALQESSKNANQIAQFLTRLSNISRTPIVKVGLPSARPLLAKNMFQARRSIGFNEWHYIESKDEWADFTRALFHLYVLREDFDRRAVRECLFKLTGGMMDAAIQLFKSAQMSCLMHDEETLTTTRIATVLHREAKIIRDALDLIKNRPKPRPRRKETDRQDPPDPSGDISAPDGEPRK